MQLEAVYKTKEYAFDLQINYPNIMHTKLIRHAGITILNMTILSIQIARTTTGGFNIDTEHHELNF